MPTSPVLDVDAVVFGGGAAGLWTLDAMVRAGLEAVLVETGTLGGGQTGGSQGIIHGGLKYSIGRGKRARRAARAMRHMPELWRSCLAGQRAPFLSGTRLRAECCHLWRTSAPLSRLALAGATLGLRVKPARLANGQVPQPLERCPGAVYRIEEPVIDPLSLVADLAGRHRARLLLCGPGGGCFSRDEAGRVIRVEVPDVGSHRTLSLRPGLVILCAGAGNERLREEIGLPTGAGQRRPLHMVLLRGDLPELNGHCMTPRGIRVTVTTDRDAAGRTVWQVGGELAERGVERDREEQVERAQAELVTVLPGLSLSERRPEWSTYRAYRAEAKETGGRRPLGVRLLQEENVLTTWPTKLTLVPLLARRICAMALRMSAGARAGRAVRPGRAGRGTLAAWPKPELALPPWERITKWIAAS